MDCIKYKPSSPVDMGEDDLTYPRINLSTSEDIRREMARVYRDTRSKKIAPNDATKLTYILSQILKAHEIFAFEQRLNSLESKYIGTC